MNKINDGGPAFPCVEMSRDNSTEVTTTHQWSNVGITVRDYFAAKIEINFDFDRSIELAEKIVGRSCPGWQNETLAHFEFWDEFRAKLRYIEADAMLKAREKNDAE